MLPKGHEKVFFFIRKYILYVVQESLNKRKNMMKNNLIVKDLLSDKHTLKKKPYHDRSPTLNYYND